MTSWFDPEASTALPETAGRFGAANGTMKGPGVNCQNVGRSSPRRNISQAGNVGMISGVGGVSDGTGSRALQFGLRMQWEGEART